MRCSSRLTDSMSTRFSVRVATSTVRSSVGVVTAPIQPAARRSRETETGSTLTFVHNGLVLFTSDRGITPSALATAAEERGFDTFYVPEHTHIPVRREAAHPGTGDETLPDDRYMRTLDPWISLATVAAVTSRIRLSTAVALPVESDPITLAKQI